MTLTHLDLDRIEGLAKAATPGPWEVGLAGDYPRDSALDADHTPIHSDTWGAFASVVTSMNGGGRVGTSEHGKANAAFIAALDPTTVLALITRIRELEAALEPFAEAVEDVNDDDPDKSDLFERAAALGLTAGDLRRAHAALQHEGNTQ